MWRLVVLLAVLNVAQAGPLPDQVFRDGFEDPGPPVSSIPCLAGPVQSAGLGALPAGNRALLTCFELRNDRDFARSELAYGGVPVPRAVDLRDADLARLVLAGPGDVRLPAQFRILSRWGQPQQVDAAARWLQIAVPVDVLANQSTVVALLRYDSAPTAPVDNLAISVDQSGGRWTIDTGLAEFVVDPSNPALFESIALRASPGSALLDPVLSYQAGTAGYGPRLRVGDGSGGELFSAGNELAGSLVVDAAQLREQGSTQVVLTMDGHFDSGDNDALCVVGGVTPYPAWQWSVEARFYRGRRQVDLYYLLRYACSDGFGTSWIDQTGQVLLFEWNLLFNADSANAGSHFYAGSGTIGSVASPGASATRVEQRRGSGDPWRRARVQQGAGTLESAEFFARPQVGMQNDRVLAAIQMPWMRFREPQALVAEGDRLRLQAISEPILIGEGKALWFSARLDLAPASMAQPGSALQAWRDAGYAALERGLLPHAAEWINAGDHWPPLTGSNSSALLSPYLNFLNRHHQQNVSEATCIETSPGVFEGGQWDCAKTYGAQLWPDVQFNEQFDPVVNASPAENSPYHNYWNPSGAELLEFLRSGDPQWVWDFALPQTWLMAQTAALNIGDRDDTIRNGFVVTSTGSGDGLWHRSGFGSDDYNYNRGQHIAFALRPNYPFLERIGRQGRTVIDRYNIPRAQQGTRGQFVNEVRLDRGPMQHFEGLANCAEFVPGSEGQACDTKLREILDELAQDNLASGVICSEDDPASVPCFFGQQFMISSMFYTFLLRLHQNYGDVLHEVDNGSVLRRALVELPLLYRQYGLPVNAGVIDINGQWAEGFDCTRSMDGRTVTGCTPVDIEGANLFFVNRPQIIALLLMSEWLQPDPALCTQARRALNDMFPDPNQLGPLAEYQNGGWWKGADQVLQSLVFAQGLERRCSEAP
ncbi:hypothetical protein [Pseudomarimonas arenosa]|uniref:Uncharacterized protein n=1 Tax=Pseudomarimonas arenosa TaxID=2774145 RepID=A0AAW3ZUL8_9GAMM|nr:hypothetical protein [Pseudomarimonas arenosa]MBD8528134.1 hypothetical protein [Pseudomarimonas arenosa]